MPFENCGGELNSVDDSKWLSRFGLFIAVRSENFRFIKPVVAPDTSAFAVTEIFSLISLFFVVEFCQLFLL